MNGDLDPRLLLATTLIGLGIATAQKLKDLWHQSGDDEAILDGIIAEAEARIARRTAADTPPPTP